MGYTLLQLFWFCLLCIYPILSSLSASPSPPDRPNIVLFFPDQWRFDWTDDYFIHNLDLNTPTFSMMSSLGTRFVNTIVASPLCAPSRSCIALGREYDMTGVPTNSYDLQGTSIYKLMQNNGYWVMSAGKDDLTKPSGVGKTGQFHASELGFSDHRRTQGKGSMFRSPGPYAQFLKYETDNDYNALIKANHACTKIKGCPFPVQLSDESHYMDNWITQQTLQMMDNIPNRDSDISDNPWFLQINFAGPHPPFVITESMNENVQNRVFKHPKHNDLDEESTLLMQREYAAEIENLDTQFALVIAKVKEMGEFENTIFCASSDHGEMLGEYNLHGKLLPFVGSTNVPLLCFGPGIQKNVIVKTYVTNMDLAATFLDFTESGKLDEMTSVSLKSFMNGTWSDNEHGYRKYVQSGLNEWRMVIEEIDDDHIWKMISCRGYTCNGRKELGNNENFFNNILFNIAHDLYEENEISNEYPEIVKRLNDEYIPKSFQNYQKDSILAYIGKYGILWVIIILFVVAIGLTIWNVRQCHSNNKIVNIYMN